MGHEESDHFLWRPGLPPARRAPPGCCGAPRSRGQPGQATTLEMARNSRTPPRTERGGLEGRSWGAYARIRDPAPARSAQPERPRPICVGLWRHPTPAQNLCKHPSPPLLRDQRRRAARREVRSTRYAPSSAPRRSSWRGRCCARREGGVFWSWCGCASSRVWQGAGGGEGAGPDGRGRGRHSIVTVG